MFKQKRHKALNCVVWFCALFPILILGCGAGSQDESGFLEFSEILYNSGSNDSLEYIEIHNSSSVQLPLKGVTLTGAVHFSFSDSVPDLESDGYIVLTNQPELFSQRFPGIIVTGTYEGRLKNDGEDLEILSATGKTLAQASYGHGQFWPVLANGTGYSLVLTGSDGQEPSNWKSSAVPGGTPGKKNVAASDMVITISEIMPAVVESEGWIELANSSAKAVDVGGWLLMDSLFNSDPMVIASGTMVPANGFLVLKQSEWTGGFFPALSGEHVYLVQTAAGVKTGSAAQLHFPALSVGKTAGISTLSDGTFQIGELTTATPGALNGVQELGSIVFAQIHYNPSLGDPEYVLLHNRSDSNIVLSAVDNSENSWKIEGIDVTFPGGMQLGAHQKLILVRSKDTDTAAYRVQKNVPDSIAILGYTGKLSNNGEMLILKSPSLPVQKGNGQIGYALAWSDVVNYSDRAPWSQEADGLGKSLVRSDLNKAGSDPTAWIISDANPLK
jgi:hypothetical protein